MNNKKVIQSYYFFTRVEATIDDYTLVDLLECEVARDVLDFNKWLNEQDEESNFKEFLIENGLEELYR